MANNGILRIIKKRLYPNLVLSTDTLVRKANDYSHLFSWYKQNSIHFTEKGVTDERLCDEEVIVSLTTHGARYYDAYIAIETIMQGSVKPNRIILWAPEEFEDQPIPVSLKRQMARGLEIRFVKDIKSYTKLVYALKEFPDSVIVSVDDDIIYPFDTLETLVNAHIACPGQICANAIVPIPDNFKEKNIPYMKWPREYKYMSTFTKFIFEGYAGVLYPPHCLNEQVFDESVFLDICTTSDDVWFSAMAMLNNTKCVYCCPHMNGFELISNETVQTIALCKVNDVNNQTNINRVFTKYQLI